MPIHVSIIEDDDEIRQLLQIIISGSPGFVCNQAYADSESGLAGVQAQVPDVLLMDIDLPGMSGIEAVGQLKTRLPQLPIIMLTVHEDTASVFDSLCAGAIGYLVKGIPPVQLLAAISDAHQGGSPMSPAIARRVVRSFQPQHSHQLSDREVEVLGLLCQGDNYNTIAKQLFISKNTVKSHIKNIYEKLQVNTRAEAVIKATKDRIVH